MSARLLALRAAIGGDVSGNSGTFPGPGHSRKDRSLSLLDIGPRVVYHSFAGDPGPQIADYLQANGIPCANRGELTDEERRQYVKAQKQALARRRAEEEKTRTVALRLWESAKEQLPPAALAYFKARELEAPAGFVRHVNEFGKPAAIIAPVVDPSNRFLGVHRTYYTADGQALERKMLGAQSGGCIRLSPTEDTLAIAEGVETALSYRKLRGVPCWAARSSSGLEQWRPPNGVSRVIIAADGDAAGLRAANRLGAVLRSFVRVTIDSAPTDRDWNDVLRGDA